MMKNQKGILHSRVIKVVLLLILIITSLAVRFDFYYDLNDDTAIKDIMSGAYTGTPSGYSIQMLYPLGTFIALFYRVIPGVSWYGLFLCLCQFGVIALVAYRITGLIKSEVFQIIAMVTEAVIIIGLLLKQYVFFQYSVTSGLCMAAAIFMFVTSESSKLKDNIWPVVLVITSFCIRTELCLMVMPFLLIAGFAKWMLDLKNTKNYLSIIACALAGMVLMYGIDAIATNGTDWKNYRRLFDARTKIYDFYDLPGFEGNEDFFDSIGLDKSEYKLLENYNYSLDDRIDYSVFENIVQYQEQLAREGRNNLKVVSLPFGIEIITKKDVSEGLWLYRNHYGSNQNFTYILVAGYVLFFIVAVNRKKSGWLWKIILLAGCRSLLWVYLYMVDRMVDRILCPLYMAEIAILIAWIVSEIRIQDEYCESDAQRKTALVKCSGIVLIFAMCGVVSFVQNYSGVAYRYTNRELVNPRWENLEDYCRDHSNNYYLIDVYSSTSYDGVIYSEKLFEGVDNRYKNYDICGGWVAKSPLTKEKIEYFGLTTVEKDLLDEDKNVYLIVDVERAEDMQWIIDYYRYVGKDISIIKEESFGTDTDNFIVFRLEEI